MENSIKHLEKLTLILHDLFQKMKVEYLHFMQLVIPWYQSQIKSAKKNTLKVIDTQILNKILENRIQQHIKGIMHYDQMEFISRVQGWFNIKKSIGVTHHIKSLKKKNHKITSIDSGKIFAKIQHPCMNKALRQIGIEENLLNIVKNMYKGKKSLQIASQ